jgi:hypothetical protein
VRASQLRCALYGLPIYRQGDRVGVFFSYSFYRNEAVLRAQAHKPTPSYIHELKGPLLVYVDVLHVTDEVAPGVDDAPLAQFALGRTRVLSVCQPGEVQGDLLPSLRR